MGKLIVFEGTDGSGKSTQFSLIKDYLQSINVDFRAITFPQYSEKSSTLVQMYLNGEFGNNPTDVNPYAASIFYTADRFASYKKNWGDYYNNGGLILSDRYTTSNAVHQASKIDKNQRDKFFNWLYDFEFNYIELPKPDIVIYLDVPIELTKQTMHNRELITNTQADIHEKDLDYLRVCRETGLAAAKTYGWIVVNCVKNEKMRSIADIHDEICSLINQHLNK